MKIAKILASFVLSVAIIVPSGFAGDIWEKANSDTYKEKVGPMFVRGLLNAVTSPVDILVQTVDKTKDGPPLIGTLTGMAGGLGCTALRAGSGLVDVGLFWVPGFNGFPVNRSYHNCLLCDQMKSSDYTYQTPVVQQVYTPQPVVTQTYTPQPVATQYVSDSTSQPVVSVVKEMPQAVEEVPTPTKKVRDPYRYVKK